MAQPESLIRRSGGSANRLVTFCVSHRELSRLDYRAVALLRTFVIIAAILGGFFLCVGAFALDDHIEPGWHVLDHRRQPQGLPQTTVTAILQTSDGYIWVGTFGGLARFDGIRFTTFDEHGRSRLKETEIWALAEGPDSSLWIATFGAGLTRFRNGTFTTYTRTDGLVRGPSS